MSHKITVVGLGNYGIDELPLGVYRFLQQQQQVYTRTLDHPVITELQAELQFESFDNIYETYESFEAVYDHIVNHLIEAAKHTDIVYTVPGHPRVAETTTTKLFELTKDSTDIEVEVLGGKSFIDDVFNAVNVDPNDGFTLLDATAIHTAQLNIRTHTLITQVYSALIAGELKVTLMERYPGEQMVYIVDGAQGSQARVIETPLFELDHYSDIYSNVTSVFIPIVENEQAFYNDFAFATQVIDRLVDDEVGCPWDNKQTHTSLKRYLIEESFELFEAIDNEDDWHIVEELGDILLQVFLHSSIGKKAGYFDIDEVLSSVTAKMIRRHPHVFGDEQAENIEELKEIWSTAKAKEGKETRVKFEKVFADHFLKLYDETKAMALDETQLKQYLVQGGTDNEIR